MNTRYIYIYTHTYIHTHTHTYVRTYVVKHTFTHTQYINTYVNTYIHTFNALSYTNTHVYQPWTSIYCVFRGKVNICLLARFIQCCSRNSVYVKTAYVVDCYHHPKLWVAGTVRLFLWDCVTNLPVGNVGYRRWIGRILDNLTLN